MLKFFGKNLHIVDAQMDFQAGLLALRIGGPDHQPQHLCWWEYNKYASVAQWVSARIRLGFGGRRFNARRDFPQQFFALPPNVGHHHQQQQQTAAPRGLAVPQSLAPAGHATIQQKNFLKMFIRCKKISKNVEIYQVYP